MRCVYAPNHFEALVRKLFHWLKLINKNLVASNTKFIAINTAQMGTTHLNNGWAQLILGDDANSTHFSFAFSGDQIAYEIFNRK